MSSRLNTHTAFLHSNYITNILFCQLVLTIHFGYYHLENLQHLNNIKSIQYVLQAQFIDSNPTRP